MIKLLDQKNYVFMNEYYVLHFYQVRPTIKYYLVKTYIYKKYVYIILYVMYFISYIHMIYYKIFIIYFYVKKY